MNKHMDCLFSLNTIISFFLGDGWARKGQERLSMFARAGVSSLGACWEVNGWLERLGISPHLLMPCISLCFPAWTSGKGPREQPWVLGKCNGLI